MSFGAKAATASPKVAGIDADEVATNQKATPLRWFIGEEWCPLTWIIKKPLNVEYVEIRQKVGKSTQTTGHDVFADLAGLTSVGLHDAITGIEVAKEVVWTGNITRPDDPAHPDYWRATIVTSVGTGHFYWGRADQPVDDIVLGPLGAIDASQAHPGYRNQGLFVMKRCAFGQSTSAPSIRARLRRWPKPAFGVFPAQNHVQGESIIAGALELLTSPIFGAAAPSTRFKSAAQWQQLSADVMAAMGRHSPSLDRARPVRDVIKEFFELIDGWARVEGGKIVPGFFPHNGTVPAGLTEISHHDIVGDPEIGAPAKSKAANKVVVKFRDRTQKLREDTEKGVSRSSARARQRVQPESVSALAIIDRAQARLYAAERARTRAEGESKGNFEVRRPKAVWASGAALQAGDNFNLDWLPYELDQVSRITKITEQYRATRVAINYVAERGLFPAPYVPPTALQPDLGPVLPTVVTHARVLELSPALAGTPLGIQIAFLAQRPQSVHENSPAVKARSVVGLNLHYSGDGSSYSPIGFQTTWAVRATLRAAVAQTTATTTVQVTVPADNLDLDRLAPQKADDQADDRLLLVMGDEVMSVGAIAVAGANRDFTCLRARQGTLAAAGANGAEVWLVWRDEITALSHKGFVENTTRYFKPQPYTLGAIVDLGDVDPLTYHFRDRAPEKPVIVINAMPAGLVVGVTYAINGAISDVNGDLTTYAIEAALLTGPGGTIDSKIALQSGDFAPDEQALYNFRTSVVFPAPGTWRIIVRAYDETKKFTRVQTGELTIAAGNGGYNGPDDGIAPNAVTAVTVTPGLGMFVLNFTRPSNTRLDMVRIYESATTVRPAQWSFVALEPQEVLFRTGLPNATTRSYWLEPRASNGRTGPISGPYTATTIDGINLSHLVPGLTMVEVVTAKPATGNFKGRTIFLTTDNKLYRWENDVIGTGTAYWSTKIDGADLAVGTLVAGAFSAGCVTAFAVGTNEIIANAANIKNAVITGAKIANLAVGTAHMQDLSVTTLKVAGNAITAATSAVGINRSFVAGDVTSLVKATLTVFGGRIDLDFSLTMRFLTGGSTQFQVLRDGVEIDRWHLTLPFANWESRTFNSQDTPGAGKHTYEVKIYQPNDGGKIEKPKLKIQETKR